MTTVEAPAIDVLVSFARCVRDAQVIARRLGYLAASVEENIEDVTDFHAAVESLLGAAPLSEHTRHLRAILTDADRRLLTETRQTRNSLVYDFFINHPLEGPDGRIDTTALDQARKELDAATKTLHRASDLTTRLETALAQGPG